VVAVVAQADGMQGLLQKQEVAELPGKVIVVGPNRAIPLILAAEVEVEQDPLVKTIQQQMAVMAELVFVLI
jgi:hypothetical protein